MKSVQVYQTYDGKTFEEPREAAKHELALRVQTLLVDASISNAAMGRLIDAMSENHKPFLAALGDFNREISGE